MILLGHYVPHTDDEIRSMLDFIGLSSLDELFTAVPEALRLARGLDVAPGLSEPDVLAEMDRLAGRNVACGPDLVCFAGGGAYDHEVPSVEPGATVEIDVRGRPMPADVVPLPFVKKA